MLPGIDGGAPVSGGSVSGGLVEPVLGGEDGSVGSVDVGPGAATGRSRAASVTTPGSAEQAAARSDTAPAARNPRGVTANRVYEQPGRAPPRLTGRLLDETLELADFVGLALGQRFGHRPHLGDLGLDGGEIGHVDAALVVRAHQLDEEPVGFGAA